MLVYKYQEHYFLTDPDKLINTHFPDEEPWQLLHKPVTLHQFEVGIILFLHFLPIYPLNPDTD